MADTPILEVRDVSSYYGQIQALKNVSLHINQGEIVTLIGANGAGKSTLLMTIFGTPRARTGQILYKGNNLLRLPPHRIAGQGIAQVPEGRRIFPKMTVEENIMIGTLPTGDTHLYEDRQPMFELFRLLKDRPNQLAGPLSVDKQPL